MKKYIKLALLITWMGVIYYFSSQSGIESKNLSDGLLFKISLIFGIEDIESFILNNSYIIRKLAHFTEFFILGLLMYITLIEFTDKDVRIIAIILCAIYATSDEIHQLLSNERTFKVLDILIDSAGSITSIFLISSIRKYVTKRKSS